MTITEKDILKALGELKNVKARPGGLPINKSIVAFRTKQLLERLGDLKGVLCT